MEFKDPLAPTLAQHDDDPPAAGRGIRVAAADDSFLMRQALRSVLSALPQVEAVTVASNGGDLLAAVDAAPPEVVITDLRMPPSGDAEGLRIADTLRERHPDVGVIVLSQFAEPSDVLALFRQGAGGRGYLLKDRVRGPDEIGRAISVVAGDGTVVDPMVVEAVLRPGASAERPPSPLDDLTPRELEVLAAMAEGQSNAAIAASLVVTQPVVEKYVGAIFRKLDLPDERSVSRRVAAVLVYLEARAFEP